MVEASVQVHRIQVGVGAATAEDVADLYAGRDLDALQGIEQVQLQAPVEVVQADDLVEAGARNELVGSSDAGRAGLAKLCQLC